MIFRRRRRLTTGLVLGLATATVGAPSAQAATAVSADSFKWGDAGIGAGAAVAAMLIVCAEVAVLRRGRRRRPVAV